MEFKLRVNFIKSLLCGNIELRYLPKIGPIKSTMGRDGAISQIGGD